MPLQLTRRRLLGAAVAALLLPWRKSAAQRSAPPEAGAAAAVPTREGTRFTTRPYLWQSDEERLVSSLTARAAEAFGSYANDFDAPMAFISMCDAAGASPGRGGYPVEGSFNDVPSWQLALASHLKNRHRAGSGDALAAIVAAEVRAFVAAHNDSPIITGDEYQHIEEIMLNVAQSVDCCYLAFTADERSTIASWINDAMTYAGTRNRNFWPSVGYGDDQEAVNNNYHQNHALALAVVGICSEGWNTAASTWRTKLEGWFRKYIDYFSGVDGRYVGAHVTEGRYYSMYIRNLLWAMRLYDAAMGTTYLADLAVRGPSAAAQLNLALFQIRPHLAQFFHDGSEANDTGAHLNSTTFGYFHQLMAMDPASTDTRVSKSIIANSALRRTYSWSRSMKGFENFYWSIADIGALAVSSKTDRRLALPAPGGGRTFFRSSDGWATTARAMVIFAGKVQWVEVDGSYYDSAGYSHANPDVPGFQLASGADSIVCDVEQDARSGVAHEAGNPIGSAWGNYVGTSTTTTPPAGGWPVHVFNEDNTGAAIPHYYKAINAQPMWTQCTTYVREYVVLDDLQVVVIYDRIATSGSNDKVWRLHHFDEATVMENLAEWRTGRTAVQLRDLYSTDGNAMSDSAVTDENAGPGVRRIAQVCTSNSIRSLKVLSVNDRCGAATLASGAGYLQADMTIDGAVRSVRFYDDGSHATVS